MRDERISGSEFSSLKRDLIPYFRTKELLMGDFTFLQKSFVTIHEAQLRQEEGGTYKSYVIAAWKGWTFQKTLTPFIAYIRVSLFPDC